MTVLEAAEEIPNAGVRTIQAWCKAGILEATKKKTTVYQRVGRGPKSGTLYKKTIWVWVIAAKSVRRVAKAHR